MLTWVPPRRPTAGSERMNRGHSKWKPAPLLSGTVAVLLSAQPLVRLYEEAHLEEAR